MSRVAEPHSLSGIVADSDYFNTKARQCYRTSQTAKDDEERAALIRCALTFEGMASEMRGPPRTYRLVIKLSELARRGLIEQFDELVPVHHRTLDARTSSYIIDFDSESARDEFQQKWGGEKV